MTDVVLATAADLPKPDPDTQLLEAALRERGLSAETVAWDADHDWAGDRLVVLRSTWDYVGRPAEFLRWAEDVATATRLVNPAEVVRWNADKAYLADLATKGVPLLPTAFVGAGATDELRAEALAGFDGEVVVKPAVSAGARDTVLVAAASAEAADHLASLVARGDALVQAYEPTVVAGEDSLVFIGGVFSHAVRKVPAAGDFRVQEHLGGTTQPWEPTYLQEQVAAAALAAVPADLSYARVDLARPEAPVLMELELIEPELFLRFAPESVERFADHLAGLL